MKMETAAIWESFNSEIYFFTLKKVKDTDITNEVIQNSFLKIHQSIGTLKEPEKLKAWVFQIVRNEITNHFNQRSKTTFTPKVELFTTSNSYSDLCCLDRFINNLPGQYKEVVELVYLKGKSQVETAALIGISLSNVKARIRRAKLILINNFNTCCKFRLNAEGKLVGDSNCSRCT
ncbi:MULTISPECIES: sigma-70 family RNA polymerase sigma factor [Arenibacter]|uniref:sigma-70 family RNA polymerase sigma factor n=1 Tax=Arenibacter TaxID=178469 RepID=UPI00293739B2|nr:sigma-70 family RNA polymerase sigma factor [Arenibacter catalasegens]